MEKKQDLNSKARARVLVDSAMCWFVITLEPYSTVSAGRQMAISTCWGTEDDTIPPPALLASVCDALSKILSMEAGMKPPTENPQ